ncbi:MAG TPA: hypothetical protein VIL74_20195 [Pyrinomonadaceae bacterium]|jgi:hypothetical protein
MKTHIRTLAYIGLIFSAFALPVSARKLYSWGGAWSVPSRFTPSTLTIETISATSFRFEIEATNGANTGEIAGVAGIRGNRAVFDDRQSKNEEEKRGCRLTFTHRGSFIDVEMTDKCLGYAGSGVYFANKYYKGKPKARENDFVKLEVFPDKTLDDRFRALVGGDYEKFLDSFHQIFPEDDLDGFGAKTFSACVRGICPYSAGIVMYDRQGRIWAAVLDDNGGGEISANYYTNAPEWREKPPQTIERWIAEKREFNDGLLIIVYKNKK